MAAILGKGRDLYVALAPGDAAALGRVLAPGDPAPRDVPGLSENPSKGDG